MLNEIVKSNNIINSMDDVERAAKAMATSGFFADSKSASQAIVKVLAGRELGFGAFASMTGVAVIQGKPVVGANLTAAAIKQTGKYNYRVTKHTDQECEIDFFENKEKVGTSTFTMKDAAAAGLNNKDNWKKWPRNMLFARAISNGQKWYAPDVYNGVTVYTPDEMGANVDEDGNIIDAVAHDVPAQIEKPAPKANGSDKRVWTVAQKSALIGAGLADNDFAAKGMLGLSSLPEDATTDTIVRWGAIYRENRANMTAPQAAEIANKYIAETA